MAKELKIRPLHDRVIIKRLEEDEKSAGGIILPDSAKEKPQQGEVLAVGKGVITQEGTVLPMDVKVGDKVLFPKWGTDEIKIDGEDFIVMEESKIIAVINN